MEASAKGARENGGLTVGVLPYKDQSAASEYINVVIATGMGDGRNCINVLSSDIVVSLPGKAGTISEIALALKNRKKVILLSFDTGTIFDFYREKGLLSDAGTPEEAIEIINKEMK
jgi:Predicted Rossmann fold nucleotide-binding protein